MSGWQPISTAPKDYTPVLIWIPDTEPKYHIHVGLWSIDRWENCHGDELNPPTHWQPLPTPPAEGPRE